MGKISRRGAARHACAMRYCPQRQTGTPEGKRTPTRTRCKRRTRKTRVCPCPCSPSIAVLRPNRRSRPGTTLKGKRNNRRNSCVTKATPGGVRIRYTAHHPVQELQGWWRMQVRRREAVVEKCARHANPNAAVEPAMQRQEKCARRQHDASRRCLVMQKEI